MKIDLVVYVQALAKKATYPNSETPDSALKYSQAALNLAHAMATVNAIDQFEELQSLAADLEDQLNCAKKNS
jgi:hypothetical protein